MQPSAVYRMRGVLGMRAMLAAAMPAALALTLATAGHAATIVVNSLADPGTSGICALRDAITAANTMTATNGCAGGTSNDAIQFSVTGTIALVKGLPTVTDKLLTISGPPSPGITVSGQGATAVMFVDVSATLNLTNLTIAEGATDDLGGGIHNDGSLTVTNCTFFHNSALRGGGIDNTGHLTVTNSTFAGNSARSFGGGILNFGDLTVTNSTFAGNSAALIGGGIFNVFEMVVINSTFFANDANFNTDFNGGGGAIGGNAQVASGLKGNILAGTLSGGNCFGGFEFDLGYNISDDSTCGFFNTGSANNLDPQLSPAGLAYNGGPTKTIALVSPQSPAIDAIPVADCTDVASHPLTTDQRGFTRPDVGEVACDIGAYESAETFVGHPGAANCHGESVSGLTRQFGSVPRAALALKFSRVPSLQKAIRIFCEE